MIAFLDTSALVKLYHEELETDVLRAHLHHARALVLSELSRVEFASTAWKQARSTREPSFNAVYAADLLRRFQRDAG